MPKLTKKQQAFVAEYLVDMNGTQAAIRAGYSKKTARHQATRLLSKAHVMAAVEKAFKKKVARTEISADNVLEELRRLAFSDVTDYVAAAAGSVVLHDLSELPPEKRAAIQEVAETKEGVRFKLASKLQALEALAKHLGLYRDDHHHHHHNLGGNVEVRLVFDDGEGDPAMTGDDEEEASPG